MKHLKGTSRIKVQRVIPDTASSRFVVTCNACPCQMALAALQSRRRKSDFTAHALYRSTFLVVISADHCRRLPAFSIIMERAKTTDTKRGTETNRRQMHKNGTARSLLAAGLIRCLISLNGTIHAREDVREEMLRMESYASTRMRPVNHSPTRAARRAVIHRVESEYERFDCISDMYKFGVNVQQFLLTETSAEITALYSNSRCGPWAAFFLSLFCSCVSNKPQCQGVICQTKFVISDDADVSSESGSVTVLERQ